MVNLIGYRGNRLRYGHIFEISANLGYFGVTGPTDESKRAKRIQGWSRHIGCGCVFAQICLLFRNLLCARFMIFFSFI